MRSAFYPRGGVRHRVTRSTLALILSALIGVSQIPAPAFAWFNSNLYSHLSTWLSTAGPVAPGTRVYQYIRYTQRYTGYTAAVARGPGNDYCLSGTHTAANVSRTLQVRPGGFLAPSSSGTHSYIADIYDSTNCTQPSHLHRGREVTTLIVDADRPDTTITSGPPNWTSSNAASFSFTFSDPQPYGASFRCRLDGNPATDTPCGTTNPSTKTYSNLASGLHTFEVWAIDSVGNADLTPATWTWNVDTLPPDTVIDSGPAGIVSLPDVTFTFHGEDPGDQTPPQDLRFECDLDGAGFEPCESAGTQSYRGLLPGYHVFRVRAIDRVGNADPTPAEREWGVDLTAPEVEIVTPRRGRSYANGIEAPGGELPNGAQATIVGPLTMEIDAADPETGISQVEVFEDGNQIGFATCIDGCGGLGRQRWQFVYHAKEFSPEPRNLTVEATNGADPPLRHQASIRVMAIPR